MRPLRHLCAAAGLALAGASDAASPAAECRHPTFDGQHELVEAAQIDESGDACWWLSSGALVSFDRGIARTVQGDLAPDSEWRRRYAESNPVDTDDGSHPQNLLRLVTRGTWGDARQEVRFRIKRINLSASHERGEWSGVLLLQRYRDQQTLYYAGLRMDGTAVIKKKLEGRYVTLAQEPVFGVPSSYDRDANPSLLPVGQWIGLSSVVRNERDGGVRIEVYVQEGKVWRLVATAIDRGTEGPPILAPGHTGLRSDFMDVEFARYAVAPEG